MVYHVLADGTVTKDITGHVVKMSDAEAIYHLMSKMNNQNDKRKVHTEVKRKVG
jgi:hypothetical protein